MKRKIFSKLLMGAFLIASVSMFVSCKDYDDDIQKNAQDIAALRNALGADISGVKSDLTTQLASVNSQIEALKKSIESKADADAVASKAEAKELTELVARVVVLETQIAKLTELEQALAGKADAEAVAAQFAAVNGKLDEILSKDDVQGLIDAALATLDIQGTATTVFNEKIKDALKGYLTADDLKELTENVKALDELLKGDKIKNLLEKDLMGKDEIGQAIADSLGKAFQDLDETIGKKVASGLSAIEIFVKKRVTSVVLKPSFYWEGLEAIETPFLKTPQFVENGKYDFTYNVRYATLGDRTIDVHVDNVMAWLATDGTKLCSETKDTWNAYIYNNKPTATASGVPTYFSLIEKDGTVLAASKQKTLQYVTIAPDAIAEYHINPATADLKDSKYSFFQNTAEVYTRADGLDIAATPIDTLVKYNKATGILTVPFSVKWDNVMTYFRDWAYKNNTEAFSQNDEYYSLYQYGYEPTSTWDNAHAGSSYGSDNYWDKDGNFIQQSAKLPFISLIVENNDTTVNSDYGVVVPATYTIVALADSCPKTTLDRNTFVNNHKDIMNRIQDNHLYETVGVEGSYDFVGEGINYMRNNPGAIPSPATHDVGYRDTIDLKPFIETHYSYTTYTRYGQSTVDKKMTPELMEKLGLHYEFKKIDYTVGKNVTSESAHIQQIGDALSGKFAPRSVNEADGTTIKDKEATREVIDREPLVRVDLVTRDGKIVRYGYIKLRITEAKESLDDVDVEVELGDYYMDCGDQLRLTWYQVERLILAKLNNGKGMTKQEFEQNYYFMNEGGYTTMPRNSWGQLYATADANKAYGTRWYKKDGKIVEAADATTESDAVNTFDYQKWTADNNWFGRVWYTPHDNATYAHAWDEQTNVLIWDLHGYNEETEASTDAAPDYYRGNMKDLYTPNLFDKLISVSGATYESAGLSKNAISTIVRFKNKNNDTYINVKLIIPVGKLHFQYGAVDNKDWAHWYYFNGAEPGVKDDAAPYKKEFDAHINPFKPSNNGYKFLDVTSYNQLLTDNWLDPTKMVVLKAKNKDNKDFANYQSPKAPVVSFIFTIPEVGKNSKDVSAVKGQWVVEGASGTKWTLKIGAHNGVDNTAILAVKKGDKEINPAEEVCYLDDQLIKDGVVIANNNRIHYHGLESNANLYPAATDLLNKVGAYKENGDERFTLGSGLNNMKTAEYLDNNVDKTFTAYLKLEVTHDFCYDPLIGKNLFNVRVHRPINVAAKEFEWNDRVLADNRLAIKDLVEIVDWNRFPVVPYNNSEIKAHNTMFNIDQPSYATVYNNATSMKAQNFGIPYEYYGISELAVRYDEIRTDHAKEPSIRENKYYEKKQIIANTDLVKDLNSLTSWRETGLKTLSLINADGTVVPFDVPHAYNHSDLNASGKGTQFGWLYYNNNASTVQKFHIYVPIAVKYNWGNIAYDYLFNENVDKPKKLDNDYTQTVWAIITVIGTH